MHVIVTARNTAGVRIGCHAARDISTITVAIAPGHASIGIASGKIATSSRAIASPCSSAVVRVGDGCARIMQVEGSQNPQACTAQGIRQPAQGFIKWAAEGKEGGQAVHRISTPALILGVWPRRLESCLTRDRIGRMAYGSSRRRGLNRPLILLTQQGAHIQLVQGDAARSDDQQQGQRQDGDREQLDRETAKERRRRFLAQSLIHSRAGPVSVALCIESAILTRSMAPFYCFGLGAVRKRGCARHFLRLDGFLTPPGGLKAAVEYAIIQIGECLAI